MTINPDRQNPGGPDNINELFFDALIRHQIFLLRLAGGLRNEVVDLLNRSERDLAEKIRRKLAGVRGVSPRSIARMESLLRVVERLRTRSISEVTDRWVEALRELSIREAAFVDGALKTIAPVILDTALPAVELLSGLVRSTPFEGKTLAEWSKKLAADDLDRIRGQILIGLTQGEDSRAIARRIVGSARLAGADGVTQITRRQAEAITRTSVNAIANMARRTYFQQNADLFSEELYVATLDARTTPICRSLDGERFPVGEGPIPPLHFNCRSLRTAIIDGEVIGVRPAKPVTERGLVREFVRQNGLDGRITTRAQLPRGTRGKFDDFQRRRIRELTGQVDGKVTYQKWLERQSAEFQDDVLGKTRGRLFRSGGLTLDKFVNRAGDELTLSQLVKLEREAFIKAGLDPEDFL